MTLSVEAFSVFVVDPFVRVVLRIEDVLLYLKYFFRIDNEYFSQERHL